MRLQKKLSVMRCMKTAAGNSGFKLTGRFLNYIAGKYIKPWFFSGEDPGRIKAPYVISFVFISLTVWAIAIHISIIMWQFMAIKNLWNRFGMEALPQIEALSKLEVSLVPLISILIGTAGMFIGLYNWGKKGKISASTGSENGEV